MATEANPRTLALMLRERRGELGLEQKEAARLIGVTDRGYRKWENGEVDVPRARYRRQIAIFLHLPQEEITNLINGADLAGTEARMVDIVRRVLREELELKR